MATSTRPTILLGLSVRARGPEGRRIQLHEVCYRTLDPRGDRVDWVCPIEGQLVGVQWRPNCHQLNLVSVQLGVHSVTVPKDGVLRLTFGAIGPFVGWPGLTLYGPM